MKIRIISDLHVDENKEYSMLFHWMDRDIMTIIAGDVAGCLEETASFLKTHFNNVIFVGGNHIVYNYDYKPIQQLHMDYQAEFPLNASISYLENAYKEIENVVFIGATLWTDYSYRRKRGINMDFARLHVNDFAWGNFRESDGTETPLHPQHCFGMFKESLDFIKAAYDKFNGTGKQIVLVVHHGVSPQVISKEYQGSDLDASFVSDLEDFIVRNLPNLALIIHGHVHNRFQYKIGTVPVICNPCGYIEYAENEDLPAWDKDLVFELPKQAMCDKVLSLSERAIS